MAEKESDEVTCPNCASRNVRVLTRKDTLRARPQTGNFRTDLAPISTAVTYKCQDENCGHEWIKTISL
jgi:hypothetical protein